MNAAEFQKLWDAPDGTVPDSSSSPLIWKLFEGDPHDVKVQRINLGPLFHNLVLSTYTAATNGQFRIDGSALTKGDIFARVRSATGSWGTVVQVNAAPAWTSTYFGIDVDQGPSVIIGPDGIQRLARAE